MAENSVPSEAQLRSVLDTITDPFTGKPLLAGDALQQLSVAGDKAQISLNTGYPSGYAQTALAETIAAAVTEQTGQTLTAESIELTLNSTIAAHSMKHAVKAVPEVSNIIAISSGKGGVGKSTVSANLALALSSQGASVGILDADIYGPSQPNLFALNGKPEMNGEFMTPLTNYDVQVMSIGFMIDQDTPMIWRGPMVTQALEQMLRQTAWSGLDYLILDLPPGTGDVQLTLAQKVPLAGSVVVTTPQDLSLIDARKAVKMFEKVEVPIIGVIENMSTHICSQCQHEEPIFGQGGGEAMAEQYKLPFLGAIPLEMAIREQADAGKPTVVADPDSKTAARYQQIATSMVGRLAARKKDYRSVFPKIEISNT